MTHKGKPSALAAPRAKNKAVVEFPHNSRNPKTVQAKPSYAFADILRDARMRAGIPEEALAAELGLHRHVIRDWEAGVRSPRFNTAVAWAAALGFRMELVRDAS